MHNACIQYKYKHLWSFVCLAVLPFAFFGSVCANFEHSGWQCRRRRKEIHRELFFETFPTLGVEPHLAERLETFLLKKLDHSKVINTPQKTNGWEPENHSFDLKRNIIWTKPSWLWGFECNLQAWGDITRSSVLMAHQSPWWVQYGITTWRGKGLGGKG